MQRGQNRGITEPDPPGTPLRIEKPVDKPEFAPHLPKGVLKCSGKNPNAQAAQNYSVVEDLGHTPCLMSAFEVLQSCPSQRKLCFLLLVLTMIILPPSSNLK